MSKRAALFNAFGVITAVVGDDRGSGKARLDAAMSCFAKAAEICPHHVQSLVNGAEVLNALGRRTDSIEWASRALQVIDSDIELDRLSLDGGWYSGTFDHFRVEWERAAWTHADNPAEELHAKRELLRYRLHSKLAALVGKLSHHYEAALARPDIAPARASLGCSLARAGRFGEAVFHLEHAVRANPFDRSAARALYQVHVEQGSRRRAFSLARQSALLARMAPEVVPVEPWFVEQHSSLGAPPTLSPRSLSE
jgi:tetratricopeptide (TPR) repeat protein